VTVVAETLARLRPRLTQVAAPPNGRSVPLARGGGVDRARLGVVDGVVDGPALAEGASRAPLAAISVALEQEAALARPDEQHHFRHRVHLPVGRLHTP